MVVVPPGHGTVTVKASGALGAGSQTVMFSYGPTVPAFPTFGSYPSWLPANFQVSNVDHAEGSDTTLFMMETIGTLYNNAGLFPFSCQLTTSPQNQQCLTPANNGGNNPDNTQSDTADNFAATEQLQGVNDVGSGNGQSELCGTIGTPVNTTVDYSRSSKPFSVAGCKGQGLGYAKDSVPVADFQVIDPQQYGTPTGYVGTSFISYDYTTGAVVNTPFPERWDRRRGCGLGAGRPLQLRTQRPRLLGHPARRRGQHPHAQLGSERSQQRRLPALVPARPEPHGR